MAFAFKGVNMSVSYGESVRVYEPSEVIKALGDSIQAALSDLTTTWQKVASEVLQPAVAQQFAEEGAYFETPWVELAPATVKRRGGSAHPILRRTDRLMDSFDTGDADHIENINPDGLEWGSNVDYGIYHQEGTERMPARPIIPVTTSEATRDQMRTVISDGVNQALKDAGFNVEG